MGNTSSVSEPDGIESLADRLNGLFSKPGHIRNMLQIIQILSDANPVDKQELIRLGILSQLIKEIGACYGRMSNRQQCSEERRCRSGWTRRQSASTTSPSKGVGFGSGSTKSKWDIDRVLEEKILQQEQLMWLICALTTFLCGDALKLSEPDLTPLKDQPDIPAEIVEELVESPILHIFDDFNNDSIFDISQRMDFYQALIELATALAYVPGFLPHLVSHKNNDSSKSIAKELLPRFRATLNQYPRSTIRGQSSPDFIFMDFIRRVNDLSDIIFKLAKRYEQSLPPEERVKTAVISNRRQPLEPRPMTVSMNRLCTAAQNSDSVYVQIMQNYQIQTQKMLNEAGKPIYGFSFKKDLRNVNPFSPSLKERTKRIAKELASIHSALPLNASNAIYICMDESRCDFLKVLITGPADTPYCNGVFEFDVFFPTNYPNIPPKLLYLTTGGGNIRFNPNLYADGKICLSILGTWEGRPEERWNPQTSSLLQVLISIQSLIFVSNPYFNEPGFERFQETPKGIEFSTRYASLISQATLQFAIHEQYKHPSPFFKDVIKRHFWLKRHAIIEQAEKWLHEMQLENQSMVEMDADSGFSETPVYMSPAIQRQNVQKLINDFKNMPNPLLTNESDPQ